MGSAGGVGSAQPVKQKKEGNSRLKNFHNLLHFSTHHCFRCDWFCGKYRAILRMLSAYTRGHMFPPPSSEHERTAHSLTAAHTVTSLHFTSVWRLLDRVRDVKQTQRSFFDIKSEFIFVFSLGAATRSSNNLGFFCALQLC